MLSHPSFACRLLQAESELNDASSSPPLSTLSSQNSKRTTSRGTNDSIQQGQRLQAPVRIAAHSLSRVQPSSKPSKALQLPGVAANLIQRRSGSKSASSSSSAPLAASSSSQNRPAHPSKLGAYPPPDTPKPQLMATSQVHNRLKVCRH